MRSSTYGVIANLSKSFNLDISLEMFRRMCIVRYFELGIIDAVKEAFITYPIYLSAGQESIASALSLVIPDFMIFAQHRCHATYLSFGGSPMKLRDELLGLPSGTSGGMAGSNCVQCHENNINMYGHHGLIGENVPLAVGAALGSNKPAVCLFGDGAAEEDYVFAAMGFAATHKLPVMFVCEDNNLSIMTTVDVRRRWSLTKVAEALGMRSIDITDDPWTIFVKAQELRYHLPVFINIYTCRANWHVGVGVDGPPEWDRNRMVRDELVNIGLGEQIIQIEKDAQLAMEKVWDKKRLQTLLGR